MVLLLFLATELENLKVGKGAEGGALIRKMGERLRCGNLVSGRALLGVLSH